MVATRGTPVQESERKSTLPTRESRKSTRGTLQEPEDELFWESDDPISRERRRTRSVNVTFKDATTPRSPSSRSPEPVSESLPRKRQDEVDAIEETDTEDDVFVRCKSRKTRGQRSKDQKSSRNFSSNFMINGDDLGEERHMGDDELNQSSVRRSLRRPKYKEFDQSWLVGNKKLRGYPTMVPSSEPENDEPRRPARKLRRHLGSDNMRMSPRSRSSRFRKMETSSRRISRRRYSGPDEEELVQRTTRRNRLCSPKNEHSDEEMIRTTRRSSFRSPKDDHSDEEIVRSTRRGRIRSSKDDHSDEEMVSPTRRKRISSPKSEQSDEEIMPVRNRRSIPPRRYREEDNTEDDDENRIRTRFSFRRSSSVKEPEQNKKMDEIKRESPRPVARVSRKRSKAQESDMDEKNNSDDKVEDKPARRIRTRSTGEVSDNKSGEDTEDGDEEEEEEEERPVENGDDRGEEEDEEDEREEEEEEDDEEEQVRSSFKKPVRTRTPRDPIVRNAMSLRGRNFDDMYTRVKRERRPVKRFMYEDDSQERRRNKSKRISSSSDESDNKEDEDDDDDDDEENEEDEEEGQIGSRYSLRQNRRESRPFQVCTSENSRAGRNFREESPRRLRESRNHKRFVNSPARKHMFHRKKRRAAHNTTSSDSSSSDESHFEKRKARSMAKSRNRCLPMNMNNEDMVLGTFKDRAKIGSSLADIDPMNLDREVSFDSVGGLASHVKALKEMIIFPLLYSEVFERFKITPPRGVLFHGPPGTGKTLVARALANECAIGDKKVAFFMRKGADCLSKWVGESERQLRLLFDQAYQMRPSIIFFDEIDGLAPVRSSRQDQIHSSIVSTLLALMDGLDSRGEVVIIGATNRIDAIDPALRRPGRFDREFSFPLPSYKGRLHILKIHTDKWDPKPSKKLLHHLAQQTVGYCGADLKSLCAEATLVALRSKFPQIYMTKQKLLIDVSQIKVMLCHFRVAMSKIVAAAQRSAGAVGRRLSSSVQPLLSSSLNSALCILGKSFPHAFAKPFNVRNCSVHRPRLLLTGVRAQGQTTHLAPSIIHALEKVPTHKLDLSALYSVSARAPEEACAQMFHEAKRNLPSIIYVPHIDQWWGTTSDILRATFASLLHDTDPSSPLLLLATSDVPYDELDEEVQTMFSVYHKEVLSMTNPTEEERRQFFKPLFYTHILQKPKVRKAKKQLEELPAAPPPPQHDLNSKEMKRLEELEEATLRELRIFLREICAKLAKNRTFYIFTKPVDEEEVPDYTEIIKEPMDLETMMTKIDKHQYECAQEFLNDIDLICNNALEYNPDRNPEDKIIRHRACTMRDTAYAYIKAEMDTDFEYKCRDIRDGRKKRYTKKVNPSAPNFINTMPRNLIEAEGKHKSGCASAPVTPHCNTNTNEVRSQRSKSDGYKRRKRRSAWARGEIKQPKKKRNIEKEGDQQEKEDGSENKDGDDEKKMTEEERSEEDEEEVSVHSTDNSDGLDLQSRQSSEVNHIDSNNQVSVESEVALFNGHLSTEDSHDSMRVTSAADELAAKASACNLTKDIRDDLDDRSMDTIVETEDSVVSSSEQGGGTATEKHGIIIDWNHLQAVYESCISATNGAMVDDLQRLYTSISSLIKKHIHSVNRTRLLQEMEAEIRWFTQFHKKS